MVQNGDVEKNLGDALGGFAIEGVCGEAVHVESKIDT